ncbi:hypothetical protein [Nocardia fusca]|uniref:hypothetical protein n=1 Tax=Nocardia fusca TaxID=941183 RepID=UPI0007A745B0|nr:hypothetical protein [Nocardia fusca]
MSHLIHPTDRRLRGQQEQLETDLAVALDLEAGLREVLTLAHHDDLVEDLSRTLDLDAGLLQIVPEARPVATESFLVTDLGTSATFVRSGRADEALLVHPGVEREILKRLSLRDRWELRNGMLRNGLQRALMAARILAADVAEEGAVPTYCPVPAGYASWPDWFKDNCDVFEMVAASAGDGLYAGIDYLYSIAGQVPKEDHSTLELQWDRRAARATTIAARARDMKHDAPRQALFRTFTITHHAVLLNMTELAEELATTIHGLNDFVGEDLRAAGLEKDHLDGLRWSARTKWPEDWKDEIDRDSVPIGDGIFEVRPGNTRIALA